MANHFQCKAATVAALYKERWEIETFFKHPKQRLKVSSFQFCRHLRECRLHPDLDSADRDTTLQVHSKTGEI
ncbi:MULTISPECIES: transposase [Sphingobacterium]|uniref:transposase n=1 Tax=Sphingobacterium TaxID=28453 RepID=UPI0035E404CA